MALESFDEALLAELLVSGIVGFGDAVGVEGEGVARAEAAFSNFAIPILEDAQDGGSGVEALDGVVTAKDQAGKMAAVGVAQAAGGVVIFGEEEGGEGAVGSVVAKELVHRAQEALGLIESNGALAAQIGWKVGHQEGGGDACSGNVADDEVEAVAAEIDEIVIIAADFAS